MFNVKGASTIGELEVMGTDQRGLNPDELTGLALRRIIFVGPDVPPVIRDQAIAFKEQIAGVLHYYLTQAQKSQNTSVCNMLEDAGEYRAAALVRAL